VDRQFRHPDPHLRDAGWGLNIVVGLAGLLDLGYVAFYAVGAYSYALLATHFGLASFWICLPLAGILAAFWGMLLGFPGAAPARRLSRHRHAGLRRDHPPRADQLDRLLQRRRRHLGIPRVTFFGVPFTPGDKGFAATFGLEFTPIHRTIFLYYVILALALLTNSSRCACAACPSAAPGKRLREDEIACRSLGINTVNTKLTAFAIGAMFGGFAGSFFAVRQGFISPEASPSWNRR
jgi:branched-chain amino acid transport system permease protein